MMMSKTALQEFAMGGRQLMNDSIEAKVSSVYIHIFRRKGVGLRQRAGSFPSKNIFQRCMLLCICFRGVCYIV